MHSIQINDNFNEKVWSTMQTPDIILPNMSIETLTLSEILTRLMFARRIRTTELARQVNIPQPTLSRIVSGATTNPHQTSLKILADFFGITVDQLRGYQPISWLDTQDLETPGLKKIPFLTWEQVGEWDKNKDKLNDYEQIFTDAKVGKLAYSLAVKDASMEPLFSKGTLLIIDSEKTPKDRSFVIASIKNYSEAIFRQLVIDGPHQYLKPISPDFDRFQMSLLSDEDTILGVLVQARRDYEE